MLQRIIHTLGQLYIWFYNLLISLMTCLVFYVYLLFELICKALLYLISLPCKKINNQNETYIINNTRINIIQRYIKKCIIFFFLLFIWGILIIKPIWLQKLLPNYFLHSFIYISQDLFVRIICSIGFLGLGWTLILFSYGFFRKHTSLLLILFCIISLLGIALYAKYDLLYLQQERTLHTTILGSGNDINNALSSFFPSRGDIDVNQVQKNYDTNKANLYKNQDEKKAKINSENESKNLICMYVLFHCIAYLFCGIMTTSLWGRRFVNHLHNIATLDKNKYVFWGQELDERCLILGQDIYNNRLHSEIIVSLFDNHIANYIDENRLYDNFYKNHFILVIYDENYFPFSNLFAPYHFFISDDEAWNVKGCIKLLEERKKYKIKKKIDIYVRLREGEKCNFYETILDSLQFPSLSEKDSESASKTQKNILKNIYIHVFNESELIARDFINNHPTLQAPSVIKNINHQTFKLRNGTKLKILLLGFGGQGKQMLANIVESSQFLTEDQKKFKSLLSVDIIDKEKNTFEQYKALRSNACKKYNLNFNVCDVMSAKFLILMGEKMGDYDRIIISLGNDNLNMEAYLLLLKLQKTCDCKKDLDIFVKQCHLPFEFIKQVNYGFKDSNLNEHIFGLMSSVYTNAIILDESIDHIAKYLYTIYKIVNNTKYNFKTKRAFFSIIHSILNNNDAQYNKISEKMVSREWQEASIDSKQSSIAQAIGLKNLLYLLGYKIIDNNIENLSWFNKLLFLMRSNISNRQNNNLFNVLKNQIISNYDIKDILAENEHMRWEAYMLMKGIKPWIITIFTTRQEVLIKDPNKGNVADAKHVDDRYQHGALVDFKRLRYVDAVLEQLDQTHDLNASCYSLSKDISNLKSKKFNPSKLQIEKYNVNLLPFVLQKAKVSIAKIN